jgi:hypothetical protein
MQESEIENELMGSHNRAESIPSIIYNEAPENRPRSPQEKLSASNVADLPTAAIKSKPGDSVEKSSADTEGRKFELKPRFSEKVLKKLIMDRIVTYIQMEVTETPSAFYEIKLYEICKKARLELDGRDVSFRCIEQLHHLIMLSKDKSVLTSSEFEQLEDTFQEIKRINPTALLEYRIIKRILAFCSAMIVKWGLITLEDYNYRLTGRSLNVKVRFMQMIDLERMNHDILCIETLWFTSAVHQRPLCDVMDQATKQYAIILQRESIKIFNYIVSLNNECDFNSYPNIAGIVATRNKEVRLKMKIEPEPNPADVPYQHLPASIGLFTRCFKSRSQEIILTLREMLMNFELSYRTFEKSMIGNLLLLVGKDSYSGTGMPSKF